MEVCNTCDVRSSPDELWERRPVTVPFKAHGKNIKIYSSTSCCGAAANRYQIALTPVVHWCDNFSDLHGREFIASFFLVGSSSAVGSVFVRSNQFFIKVVNSFHRLRFETGVCFFFVVGLFEGIFRFNMEPTLSVSV